MFKYKVGDFAWVVPTGEKKAVKVEILKINFEVEEPYVSIMEVVESKYRVARPEDLADTSSEARKLKKAG
tara:strand:+ start:5927 stop:6136 length:210 start_codon:yes stop_codon:yes gene_type:complete